jgi:hypothetical protein
VVPFKHYAASVIGESVEATLAAGQSPYRQEKADGGVPRQTVGRWVEQFEAQAPAHLLHSVAGLGQGAGVTAACAPDGVLPVAAGRARSGGLAEQAWRQFLAWEQRERRLRRAAEAAPVLLEALQPALSGLRPAVGVFRVPLNQGNQACRGPPA